MATTIITSWSSGRGFDGVVGENPCRSSSRRAAVVCFLIVMCVLHLPAASTKWVVSSFETTEDWKFLTRFCFLSHKGRFDYVFKYPKSYGIQQLLLYYDRPGQWESVYKSSKNCSERSSVLSIANNQIIDLTSYITKSRDAGCSVYKQDGVDYYNCTDHVSFSASRERWWYIVVARCTPAEGGKVGLKLDYKIHMMNGEADDYLHHELSADEFYILPVDIAFLLVFLALLVISIICAVKLFNRQMLHTTYKMYMTALSLWIFGLFLECIAWGEYGKDGWEKGSTEVAGRLFRAASTAVFLLMLLLLAKGYTVTRGRLTHQSTLRLTIFFCLYCVVNAILFVWEGQFFDEGLVLYFYESPPGYGLVAMRIVAWLWFLYAFFFTIKHHPNKATFYVPFFIFYSVWFWTGPIVTMIAIFAIAKWSREKSVNGVEQFVALCGYLFFLVLTLPCSANKNFPYHLRVSQVRFSDDETEATETYGMSEESRQYLDSMFTVSGASQAPAATASAPHSTHLSHPPPSSENGGYANGGFCVSPEKGLEMRRSNGSNTPSAQNNTHAPIYGPSENPPSYDDAARLPPLESRGGSELPPITNRGGSELPPIAASRRGSDLPPLQKQQPSGGSRLAPLNEGRPVPAVFSSAVPPSASPLEHDH